MAVHGIMVPAGKIFIIVCVVLLPMSAVQASMDRGYTQIILKTNAVVNDNTIFLNDVAEISGPDSDLVDRLGKISLGTAPKLGKTDILNMSTVKDRLERRTWAHGVILDGMGTTEITRAALRISGEKIGEIGTDYLERTMPWQQGRARISSVRANDVLVPEAEISFEVTPQKNEDYIGEVVLLISIKEQDTLLEQAWWRGEVLVDTETVVALRRMQRGTVVRADDVTIRTVEQDKYGITGIRTLEEVVGKRLRRTVRIGDVMRSNDLESAPVIERGDVVAIVAESSHLRVSMLGIAQEEGCVGETIRVMNTSSKKEIVGRISDSSTVKVVF